MRTASKILTIVTGSMVFSAGYPAAAQNAPACPQVAGQPCTAGEQLTFEDIEVPVDQDRGVFIEQIGIGNRVEATQAGGASSARIAQQGDDNRAEIDQSGGIHYAAVAQEGNDNGVTLDQDGTGQTALFLAQQGKANVADVLQRENGVPYSAAAISQSGNANSLTLIQDGNDNQARLTQDGSGNAMTATQLGATNRLEWAQAGDGLSDLQIEQSGGSTMYVLQTNSGGN